MSDTGRSTSRPTEVGKLVGGVLRKAGLADGLEKASASMQWPERVGRAIAAVTRVRSVSGSTVFVEVQSSAWLQELTFRKVEILERMNEGHAGRPFERIVFLLAEDGVEGEKGQRKSSSQQRREQE